MERLKYYIAHNSGLDVMRGNGAPSEKIGEFFPGRTVEHIVGARDNPEIVYAAIAFDGGYRTLDGGRTWEKIMDGDVRQFSVDPHDERVVYMGMGPIRLLRSEDRGKTWEPLDGMLDFPQEIKKKWAPPPALADKEFAHVRYIFIHPDDQNLLFVLLEHGGILLSRDRGKTWVDRSTGIDYLDMHALTNYPGSTERYYVTSARGFYRTDDAGVHWRRVEHGMPWEGDPINCYSHDLTIVNPGRPRMVVCGGRGSPGVWAAQNADPGGHILLSDDGGDSWRIAAKGMPSDGKMMPWALAPHPSDPNALYCALGTHGRGFLMAPDQRGLGALYLSRDAGDSWEPVMTDTPSELVVWVAPD